MLFAMAFYFVRCYRYTLFLLFPTIFATTFASYNTVLVTMLLTFFGSFRQFCFLLFYDMFTMIIVDDAFSRGFLLCRSFLFLF